MGSGVNRLAALLLVLAVLVSGCSARGSKGSPQEGGLDAPGRVHAAFDPTPSVAQVGAPVRFLDRSTGAIAMRAWDFGDGSSSTEPAPVHTYRSAGVVTVTLRVRSPDGVQDRDAKPLLVRAHGTGPTTDANRTGDAMDFGTPRVARASNGGEPSLAVDSRGNFYVSPPGVLLKSTDEGKSWATVNYHGTISGDSHVVVDKDDRVWMSDLQGFGVGGLPGPVPGAGVVGPDVVWSSTDGGATWTSGNPDASVTPFTDRQWLAATGGGVGYLLYVSCTVPLVVGCLEVGALLSKTTDGGVVWSPPTTRSFSVPAYPFANRADGTLYIVESSGTTVSVAVSTDGGASFTEHTAASRQTETGNLFVNGAVDDAGNAYIAWADTDRGETDVYMSYSTDKGTTWRGPFLVSASVGTHIMPWIAAGGDGKVVVAWYGTDVKGDPNTLDAKANWYLEVAQSLDAHDAAPVFVGVRASGTPIHVGAICTSGLSCTGDRDLLDFFMVQVTPDGRAAVAYASDGATSETKALFVLQTGGPRAR